MPAGISQEAVRRMQRKIPPIRQARALVFPGAAVGETPEERGDRATSPPCLNAFKGVAWVMASMPLLASDNRMPPGRSAKDIMTKARPTMAGLKMFIPRPPKMILPMPMAMIEAITPTNHGAVPGRDSAKDHAGDRGGNIPQGKRFAAHSGEGGLGQKAGRGR